MSSPPLLAVDPRAEAISQYLEPFVTQPVGTFPGGVVVKFNDDHLVGLLLDEDSFENFVAWIDLPDRWWMTDQEEFVSDSGHRIEAVHLHRR